MMAASDFEQRTEAFLAWFKALPGATFSDAIKIVNLRNKNAGRGIIAKRDIEPDTTLFTIPRKGIINIETSALPTGLPNIFDLDAVPETDGPQQDSWSSLILVMIYEFLRGEQSSWKPYFDVLPVTFDTPMFWSEGELEELQASATRSKVGKAEAEEMFRTNIIPIIRQNSDKFASSENMSDEELTGLAHRMGSTIMSYAFDLENEEGREEDDDDEWVEDRDGKSMMGMVPMADILNADAEFNAHVNHGEEDLTVTSLRMIKAGEEILNYYGPHPNSELLRRYGYVTPKHARHDVVEIPWGTIETSITSVLDISAEKLQQVREHLDEEELEDTFVLERECGESNPDGTFPGPASITEMPADLLEQLKAFLKVIKKVQPDSIPDKRKRDDAIQAILASSLYTLESSYATNAAEDERLLQNDSLSQRQRMAIETRLGEKILLQEAKEFLQAAASEESNEATGPNKRTKHAS